MNRVPNGRDELKTAKSRLLVGKHPKKPGEATVAMDADDPRWNDPKTAKSSDGDINARQRPHAQPHNRVEDARVTPSGKTASDRLHLVPVSLAQANEHVAAWHRHNRPTPGAKFCVGAADDEGVLHAVAIAGRPVARAFDDGMTIEVCRVASDGHKNACSMLYAACSRASFALGYRRVITYTQAEEGGSSLRAAGWRVIASRPARVGWSVPSRPRDNGRYVPSNRQLWEAVA